MSEPFMSVVVREKTGEEFNYYCEVYLLGPQFCGGDKFVIARVYPEAVRDAMDIGGRMNELPEPVRAFLEWVEQQASS